MTEKIYRAWHVCPADMMTVLRPDRPRMQIVEGETLTMSENDRLKPRVGADGLHGAVLLLDALRNRNTGGLCLVDIWGDADIRSDAIAGRYRRAVRIIPQAVVDIECRFFAAAVAHRLLTAEREAGREPRKTSWDAVEVARRFAVGSASDSQASAASSAAWAAAWAAAVAQAAVAASAAWAASASAASASAVASSAAWAAAQAAAVAAQAASASAVAAQAAQAAVAAQAAAAAAVRRRLSLELENRLLLASGVVNG